MYQTQESQRTSYLVVPHSARSPVENKRNTRGNVLSLWCSLYRPQCPPSQRGFNERQRGHRRSCELHSSDKPIERPCPILGGLGELGKGGRGWQLMWVCAGREGGVHQWGHCVMSAGSLSLLWCVFSPASSADA